MQAVEARERKTRGRGQNRRQGRRGEETAAGLKRGVKRSSSSSHPQARVDVLVQLKECARGLKSARCRGTAAEAEQQLRQRLQPFFLVMSLSHFRSHSPLFCVRC